MNNSISWALPTYGATQILFLGTFSILIQHFLCTEFGNNVISSDILKEPGNLRVTLYVSGVVPSPTRGIFVATFYYTVFLVKKKLLET